MWHIGKSSTWQVVLECESSFRLCIQESPYFLFQVEGDEAFLQLLEHFPTAALLTLNVWKLCAKHHIFKYWNENSGGQNIQFCPWDICQIPASQSSLFWWIAIGKFVSPCAFEHSSLTTLNQKRSRYYEPFEETALLRFLAAVPNVKSLEIPGRYPSAIKKQVLKCLHENYCIEYFYIIFDDEAERFASICNRNKYLDNQKRFVKTKPMDLDWFFPKNH